jgi:WhiB family redox-sensing transcriptional regulator
VADWRDKSACLTEDPDLFFPETARQAEQAREICSRCTVRAECLEDAKAQGDTFAIRGGLTPAERLPAKPRLPRGVLADPASYLPILDDLVGVLQCIAAVTIPADPEAAEHRRVLLAELDAYEAEHPGPHRWGQVPASGEPVHRPAADDRLAVLRRARNEARHHRMAGVPVPEPVGELEREFWRVMKRKAAGRAA